MNKLKSISLVLAFVLLGFTYSAQAGINITIGAGDYYSPVGDYDYLPYGYQGNPSFNPGPINFQTMMGQYGNWMSIQPFGQVWQPYVANDWRPYTQGHWIYTQQYGPYWQGYEPWAWAGYHYGNWAFTQQAGWVWIPGYDWHAGRVAWSQGYDSIGWVPLPPNGYDYSRGYLSYAGPQNQFSYYDNDFGNMYGNGYVSSGGPYYNQQYRNSYYNPSFLGVAANLFTFILAEHFNNDNYANYYLPPTYTNYLFQQRLVRINPRPIDQVVLQRIVRQPIQPVQVEVRTLQTDRQPIKVVIPTGQTSVEEIRRNASGVVRDVIAPAFAQKQKAFKGAQAADKDVITRVFRQENVQPKVETVDSDQLVQRAKQDKAQRDQQRIRVSERAQQKVEQEVKQGKVRGPKNRQNEEGAGSEGKIKPEPQGTERPTPEGRPVGRPENKPDKTHNPGQIENQQERPESPANERNKKVEENQGTDKEKNATVESDKEKANAQSDNEKQNKEKKSKKAKAKDKDKNKNNNGNEEENPQQQ